MIGVSSWLVVSAFSGGWDSSRTIITPSLRTIGGMLVLMCRSEAPLAHWARNRSSILNGKAERTAAEAWAGALAVCGALLAGRGGAGVGAAAPLPCGVKLTKIPVGRRLILTANGPTPLQS